MKLLRFFLVICAIVAAVLIGISISMAWHRHQNANYLRPIVGDASAQLVKLADQEAADQRLSAKEYLAKDDEGAAAVSKAIAQIQASPMREDAIAVVAIGYMQEVRAVIRHMARVNDLAAQAEAAAGKERADALKQAAEQTKALADRLDVFQTHTLLPGSMLGTDVVVQREQLDRFLTWLRKRAQEQQAPPA